MKPESKLQQVPSNGVFSAFQLHQEALRRYISRLVRRPHDIDDIAQETFLRAYNAEKSHEQGIDQPKSFLFRIAHNVAITNLTRKSRQMMDCLEEASEGMLTPPLIDEVIARQTIGIYCEAVAQLPTQCRRVFLMRKVHGMSHRDIAEQLGISHRTVEKHVAKGSRDCERYVRERQATVTAQKADPTQGPVKNAAGGVNNG